MARSLPLSQLVGIPLTVFTFLLLMTMGWGSVGGFFVNPARAAMALLLVVATPVMTFSTGGRSKGVDHAADVPWFFPALVFHSLFTALVMPFMDARGLWVLPGGDILRWVGVALFALGVYFRLAAMLALGRRFTSVVAVQAEHRLHTAGLYALVRHPSYVGILLMDLGFAGIFRSALALALLPLVLAMFRRRMEVEEAFLIERFGDQYRAYMARTARLLPGAY